MVDIGINEGLDIRESPEGRYFIVWPFGRGPQWGNVYTIEAEPTEQGVRITAPAMPGFIGEGGTREEAETEFIRTIKAYLYRLKNFLDVAEPLVPRYIAPDFYHSGEGNVVIQPEGISVWAIIGAMKAISPTENRPGSFDRFIDDAVIREIAMAYGVAPEAARAAVGYYYHYRQIIDARIQANDVAA